VITGNGLNKIKPPTYDGQTSWATYQLQFEAAANAMHRFGRDLTMW